MKLTKKEQTAVLKTIAHWTRMIQWAKKQPETGRVSRWRMERKIKESWYADDCDLCALADSCCRHCILWRIPGDKNCATYGSPWRTVAAQLTWGPWVRAAMVMKRMLKGLLKP